MKENHNYNGSEKGCIPSKEHIQLAEEMALNIIDRFNPGMQNDMVLIIKERVRENRIELMERAEKELCGLRESLTGLNDPSQNHCH